MDSARKLMSRPKNTLVLHLITTFPIVWYNGDLSWPKSTSVLYLSLISLFCGRMATWQSESGRQTMSFLRQIVPFLSQAVKQHLR